MSFTQQEILNKRKLPHTLQARPYHNYNYPTTDDLSVKQVETKYRLEDIYLQFLEYLDKKPGLTGDERYLVLKTMYDFANTALQNLQLQKLKEQQEEWRIESHRMNQQIKNNPVTMNPTWFSTPISNITTHPPASGILGQITTNTCLDNTSNQKEQLTQLLSTSGLSETSSTSFTSKLSMAMKSIKNGLGMK